MDSKELLILVATMTGTALMAAEDIAEYCNDNDINTTITEMDNANINITQLGFGNEINFSFAHQNNTFNFLQSGRLIKI